MITTYKNATTGMTASAAGIGLSLSNIEAWLRVLSLVVGILIGIWTLYRMYKNPPQK